MPQEILAHDPDSMTAPHDGLSAPAVRSGLRASLLIGLCCMVVYNANLRSISAGDTYPARYLPFAIVQYQTLFLNPIEKVAAQGRPETAFWMLHRPDGRILSLYPVVVPVLVAPLYVPAVGYLHARGWSDARLDHVAKVMEKLAASFLASLSAALLYLLLLRRTKPSIALLLTVAYAFGTTTWVISSQALWQHGMAEVLLIGALLMLTGAATAPRALAAGLLLGLLAGNRPPDLILAGLLGIYGLYWAGRRRMIPLLAGSALSMGLVLLYNFHAAGNILGGYGVVGNSHFFQYDILRGVAGLLVSPTRGLFVFSPFLLFLLLAWRYLPRSREERFLTLAMAIGVAIHLVLYAKVDWRGGLSWGPRYLTDLLPFLLWMLVPVVAALRGAGRIAFVIAVAVSIVIEAIGAFSYTGSVDDPIFAADRYAEKHDLRGAWQWRNAPFLNTLKHGFAPADLLFETRGSFDAIESGGRAVSAVSAGEVVDATGWALAGDETPWQVAVLIDSGAGASTRTFLDRPDVRNALRETSLSGWRVRIDTAGLTPGEHQLTALVWGSARGEAQYLAARTLTVRAATTAVAAPARVGERNDDLDAASAKAAARIREHQQADGSWLTAYTSQTRFLESRPEMNTFLTSYLVELLDPVAATNGVQETLQRARKHLTSQIESDGLVRYHGLPDGPGIGTLGCAITPDTDNTALVWRLAPAADRGRLTTALATIDRYRTRDGLYRTWLAPRENYQCLDPGADPNPADIAIQMHLLLLLAEVRPAAARALCEAVRSVVDDDRVWVYYRKAPLVPMLRLPDLRKVHCTMELPESRMRTEVPEQQIWLSVARLLEGNASNDRVLVRAVLRELARDDFALIRANPPLLYHNDLTATVPRYYWSEDVGYALWLRLHEKYDNPGAPDL
ncbi:MAG TPA: hypothetical protein VHW00_00620 [Thermoanaerobaculia bacterium]|nr:hypothetical protein [Thermoanaerobaculia bacterium]